MPLLCIGSWRILGAWLGQPAEYDVGRLPQSQAAHRRRRALAGHALLHPVSGEVHRAARRHEDRGCRLRDGRAAQALQQGREGLDVLGRRRPGDGRLLQGGTGPGGPPPRVPPPGRQRRPGARGRRSPRAGLPEGGGPEVVGVRSALVALGAGERGRPDRRRSGGRRGTRTARQRRLGRDREGRLARRPVQDAGRDAGGLRRSERRLGGGQRHLHGLLQPGPRPGGPRAHKRRTLRAFCCIRVSGQEHGRAEQDPSCGEHRARRGGRSEGQGGPGEFLARARGRALRVGGESHADDKRRAGGGPHSLLGLHCGSLPDHGRAYGVLRVRLVVSDQQWRDALC
mmetsp:Transcript_79148/g.210183  ORF Transcript_79148/g.210183 Transcript_79148/m.210183 type:complete len:341 (+) Transcript_79148:83-1105(+)